MNCDCRSKIIEQLKKLHPDAISIDGQYEILSGRAYVNYSIRLEEKKRAKEVPVLCSYCPHCGEKFSKEDV